MVISEDRAIDTVIVITLLFVAVLATIFCIWKLTPCRIVNKTTRVRKPKRRTKRSSYNKIHLEPPDEEAAGLEKESSDHKEISSQNIIANVLHRIAKRNVKVDNQPENLPEGDIMTRKKLNKESKKTRKSKKNKEENKEDYQSKESTKCKKSKNEGQKGIKNVDEKNYQADRTTKRRMRNLFSCYSPNDSDEKSGITPYNGNCASNGADVHNVNASVMTTTVEGAKYDVPPLNTNNGVSDEVDRNHLNGVARKAKKQSPFSRSVSLKERGEKMHDQTNAGKITEVLGNQRAVSCSKTPLRRSGSQENLVPCKSQSERHTRRRADFSHLDTQGITKIEHIEHFEGSCQPKMQLTGHGLPFSNYGGCANQQRKHVENNHDVLMHSSSADAPGDCTLAEYATNGTAQNRVDSRKCHTAAEVVEGHSSQKGNENCVNENGSDEKIDCAVSGNYYENHRIKAMQSYSEKKAPNVFDLPDENSQQEYTGMIPAQLENHSVPDQLPLDEYFTKEWKGETLMDKRTRKQIQPTGLDLPFSDHRGDVNQQRKHAGNNHVFLHNNSPIGAPENLVSARYGTKGTVQKRVESREYYMATEAVDGYKSQKENENYVNKNRPDEKNDCAAPGHYYDNHWIGPIGLYPEKKAPEVFDLTDENAQKKYKKMVPVHLENHSVSNPLPIDDYSAKEWRGETLKAERIRKGYSRVKEETGLTCIRQIRGDNYCALRAVLFKTLSSGISILAGFQTNVRIDDILHQLLAEQYHWIANWSFANRLTLINGSFVDTMNSCLSYLSQIVEKSTECFDDSQRYMMVLDIMNKEEENEVRIFEAIKFLMLYSSIQLYNKMQSQDFTLLGSLLFARDTSPDPEAFMKNHLNCVGDTAGIDQLEMMLLGQTLNVVIKVFRLHRVDEEDFIVWFPDDLEHPEGTVELVAEDDRHYNVTSEEA